MSPVRVQIIHSKTCPFCEFFIKEVIRPLMTMFPDLLVVEFREFAMGFPEYKYKMRGFRSKEGLTLYSYSGYYSPKYGRLPEIVIDDKRYIITAMNYVTAYKLFREIKNKILYKLGMSSDIRSTMVRGFLEELDEYLKEQLKNQRVRDLLRHDKVQIVRLSNVPVKVYTISLDTEQDIKRFLSKVDPSCKYIIVCKMGIKAKELASKLKGKGIEAIGLSYQEFNNIVSEEPSVVYNLLTRKSTCSVT